MPKVATSPQLVILRESGGSSTPRPFDSIATASGILGRPVKPGDDHVGDVAHAHAIFADSIFKQRVSTNTASRSRGSLRPRFEFDCHPLREQEGAGKAGCALHPRSRVQRATSKSAHEHTGSAEAVRPSLRNGFTAYFAISPVRRALLPPSLRGSLRKLGASVGRQNDTSSPSA